MTAQRTAFFDFDGTLLPQRNSLTWQFVRSLPDERWRRRKTRAFVSFLATRVPLSLAGAIDDDGMYRAMAKRVFEGLPVELVAATSEPVTRYIESSLFPRMRSVLDSHANDRRVLVTANMEPLVSGFCRKEDMACLATRFEVKEGRYTGEIIGAMCKEDEKVRRIQACSLDGQTMTAYGNTLEDLPLLRFVDEPVLVNPETKLSRAAGLHWATKIFANSPPAFRAVPVAG